MPTSIRPERFRSAIRFTFETAEGERLGIIAYAFTANSRPTRNRPVGEHRFQLKYGSKEGGEHELWQDPFLLYTTLLVGIDAERDIFVGFDPVLHSPTKFFISLEFKREHVDHVIADGWSWWERDRLDAEQPVQRAGRKVVRMSQDARHDDMRPAQRVLRALERRR